MKRIAIVDNEKLKEMDKKIYIQSLCPVNRGGTECIKIDNESKLLIDEVTCIGCGICVRPSDDAIKIINLPEEINAEPIHRYGENEFVLYSLPTPIFGKSIGILGVNGIGKSTAVKILAGVIRPNLGRYLEDKVDIKEVIAYFKGTEAQKYFEMLRDSKIKVSYKPQAVDLIPKSVKGKVEDLLRKVDEKNMFDDIVKRLDLVKFLDRELDKLSGGELQRVAIAATVLKKANVYLFDEPTSFLDIKQRIKVSRFIRELVNENTAVIVIEHDLIILDNISDFVYIMYGKEGAYGVVSQIRSTREGINTYLEGYMKEENIRFRDHRIKFMERAPPKAKEKPVLTSWSWMTKILGRFRLTAKEGRVEKHDVVGVLGENGIGKTTFVKLLAGVESLDTGEVSCNVRVSYKPQYIDTNSDELVMNVLQDAIQKYDAQIIRPLNLKPLFLRKVNELSGGELQRVAIAVCLAKDVDLYLLDEPSAYLDVEQRLLVSKIIGDLMELRGKSALIVDHDILFLDYISNRLMVFKGIPALSGEATGPYDMEDGMSMFLSELEITMRRDKDSKRPRINKVGSVKDREQKASGKYYYT